MIDLSFFKVDFTCDDNQYVNLVDGILFKKRYWPQTGVDHSSKDDEDRIHHVCQGRPKKIRTEQNAAQIHFRLKVNQGFLFHVNFEKQPLPRKFGFFSKKFFSITNFFFFKQKIFQSVIQLYQLENKTMKKCIVFKV